MTSKWFFLTVFCAVSCGSFAQETDDLDTKIIGGNLTTITAFPFMTSFQIEFEPGKYGHVCGASILNEYWLLTAAHCLIESQDSTSYYIRAGVSCNACPGLKNEQLMKVKKVHIHPSYTPLNRYDLAMVQLEKPLQMNKFVQPIELAPMSYKVPEGRGEIMGWGTVAFAGSQKYSQTNYLWTAHVGLVPNDKCREEIDNRVSDTHICVGDPEVGVTGCFGDSGGPFIQNFDGKDKIVAVTSFGGKKPCGTAPGAYVRVGPFIDSFINFTMKKYGKA